MSARSPDDGLRSHEAAAVLADDAPENNRDLKLRD